jgi:Na+/proline symporter
MHAIDAIILLSFVAYSVRSGLQYHRIASVSLTEYFLAGRQLGGTLAGVSMAATQFAADTPLLVTGIVATSGIFGLWRLWIYGIAFLMLGYLLAPCWRRASVLTDAELSELRFGGRAATVLRGVKAVYFGLVFNCAVLAMVLFAAARIAEPFLTWHAWLPAEVMDPILALVRALDVPLSDAPGEERWIRSADNALSLLAIIAVTTFYSTTGGLRSVVKTDLLQFGLALGGTAVYAYYAVQSAGGWQAVLTQLPRALEHHPEGLTVSELLAFSPDRAKDVGPALLTLLALQWLVQMNADGTGYLAQRCMACRSDRDAVRATIVFSWTQVVLRTLVWIPIALSLLVLMPPSADLAGSALIADREQSYVRGMAALLPPGARGILLTAMLAALASTLDTHINWGASYFTNDLYGRIYCRGLRRREPVDRELVRVARITSALIVVISLVIMTQLASIQSAWKITLLLGAGMGVMLILRWLWWRITALGELSCILVASTLSPILLATMPDDDQEALRLLLVATASTVAGIGFSLARPARDRASIEAFYERVRPPGFWGPIAAANGEPDAAPRKRLWRGLLQTATASLALFCALVGLGSWLVGSAPSWLPSQPIWTAALLALSAALFVTTARLTREEQAGLT